MTNIISVTRTSERLWKFAEFFERLITEEMNDERCSVYSIPVRVRDNVEKKTEYGRAFVEVIHQSNNRPSFIALVYCKIEIIQVVSNFCKGTYCNHIEPHISGAEREGGITITLFRRELLQRLHVFITFRFTEC